MNFGILTSRLFKKNLVVFTLLVGLNSVYATDPIPLSKWTATSGHTVQAEVLSIKGTEVTMKNEGGRIIKLPISKLIDSDQERIKEHFDLSDADLLYTTSGIPQASDLAYPLGEIQGPITVSDEASYILYLPKSLKEKRNAPLLYLSMPFGVENEELAKFIPIAEVLGWIIAGSPDSKDSAGVQVSIERNDDCLNHLTNNLPIDHTRIHYTGVSNGGSMAFYNTTTAKAYGVMPDGGYIKRNTNEQTKLVYGLGGATDYNRYVTAYAAHKYKKEGFHRFNEKGHFPAPIEHKEDGIFWMHCHYLAFLGSSLKKEKMDFEASALAWLIEMKEDQPERAYSNATYLKELYDLRGQNKRHLDDLLRELSKDEDNELYHKGLVAISDFSKEYLFALGATGGSKIDFEDPENAKYVKKKLVPYYGEVELLKPIIEGLQNRTASLNN